jgi:hypothetical protein
VDDKSDDTDKDDDDQDEDYETLFVEECVELLLRPRRKETTQTILALISSLCLSQTSTNKLRPASTFSQVDMRD